MAINIARNFNAHMANISGTLNQIVFTIPPMPHILLNDLIMKVNQNIGILSY